MKRWNCSVVLVPIVLAVALAVSAQERFTASGDGTVIDNSTGLIWEQMAHGESATWDNALAYCEALQLGGSSEWRLPNVKELLSIHQLDRSPAIDSNVFTNTGAYGWSSTTAPKFPDHAMSILGGSGEIVRLPKNSPGSMYYRCVR